MIHHLVDLGWAAAPLGLQYEEDTASAKVIKVVLPEQKKGTMWAGSVLVKATEVGILWSLVVGKVQRHVELLLPGAWMCMGAIDR